MESPPGHLLHLQRRRRRLPAKASLPHVKVQKRTAKANDKASRQLDRFEDRKAPAKTDSVLDECLPELKLSPQPLPLTVRNLRAHVLQTNPELAMASTSPSKGTQSYGPSVIYDRKEALNRFGVDFDSKRDLPPELKAHFCDIINAVRHDPPSPAARNLHRYAKLARLGNEAALAKLLNDNLMFTPAIIDGGHRFIQLTPEANFHLDYVTHPTMDPTFILNQPRPDFTNGYVTREFAEAANEKSADPPFTIEEERKLLENVNCTSIHSEALCPWLTVQFKAYGSTSALMASQLQCCRDGVAVNAYLHTLFSAAGPDFEFDAVDTWHWTLACDGSTVHLFLHWREEVAGDAKYHMLRISSAVLEGDFDEGVNDKIVLLRRRLRNLLEYAQTSRLARIKEALRHIELPPVQSPRKLPTKIPTMQTALSPQRAQKIHPSSNGSIFDNQPGLRLPLPLSASPFLDQSRKPNALSKDLHKDPASVRPPSRGPQQDQSRPRTRFQLPDAPPSSSDPLREQETRKSRRQRKPTSHYTGVIGYS